MAEGALVCIGVGVSRLLYLTYNNCYKNRLLKPEEVRTEKSKTFLMYLSYILMDSSVVLPAKANWIVMLSTWA
jgi:hypothetical protein